MGVSLKKENEEGSAKASQIRGSEGGRRGVTPFQRANVLRTPFLGLACPGPRSGSKEAADDKVSVFDFKKRREC
jgi:hypothetical protein